MAFNKIILIMLMTLPLDVLFAEVKSHVRDDDKYYYNYVVKPNNLDYYIDNPVIKEGDLIIVRGIFAGQFRYCKGRIEEFDGLWSFNCIYNGAPFKRQMQQDKPSEGYKLR